MCSASQNQTRWDSQSLTCLPTYRCEHKRRNELREDKRVFLFMKSRHSEMV